MGNLPIFVLKRAIGCSNWDRSLKIAKIINAIKIAKRGLFEEIKVQSKLRIREKLVAPFFSLIGSFLLLGVFLRYRMK